MDYIIFSLIYILVILALLDLACWLTIFITEKLGFNNISSFFEPFFILLTIFLFLALIIFLVVLFISLIILFFNFIINFFVF